MLDIFKKDAEEQKNPEQQLEIKEENVLSMLKALEEEESSLMQEKSQLVDMEEMLRLKAREEIEAKKRRIDELKNEIPELKQRCEDLAKMLDTQVQE
jgi:predicted RNase H-like nuclease (RuvC/YqgF family)